ncbi:lysophospholipid acyltransferase family protein [Tabrizicola sp.]|uniref:lysophospholipid acyltransferase family protein n=1 Tax=Tabrizicola sp. TaxID=2005166 RepID=UPI002638D253|nr:lysophospholipid acyltransferase family protein [Tabrizicola sp.]MDM7931200.1 lysophospholipid acyltransferase family protein [Tabrizicola sp.]
MTDTAFSAPTSHGYPAFTYSHAGQSRFRRGLIRTVERLSGRPRLHRLYCDWQSHGQRAEESVFDAALRLLDVRLQIEGEAHLARIPATGGLLIVANHPFGILDGLTIGQLAMRLRGNARILTNSLLCQVPEIAPHLLPVDFSGTSAARRLTSATRRRAGELLAEGKVVAIFPAGGVATANRPVKGRACDADWHPFVGRLATIPGVTTLPVHFSGQNSRLFQIASHLSYPLRVALIFHETRRRMGRPLRLTVGEPIPQAAFQPVEKGEIARHLRRRTMELADAAEMNPDEVFVWPSHVKW